MSKSLYPESVPEQRLTLLGAGPDRLDSWKEIASYLSREVRTVQLWEKNEGLPVHRHYHNQLGTVFAFRSEIEEWGQRQALKRSASAEKPVAQNEAPVQIEICILESSFASLEEQLRCEQISAEIIRALKQPEYAELQVSPKPAVKRSRTPDADGHTPNADNTAATPYSLWLDIQTQGDEPGVHAGLFSAELGTWAWSRRFQLRRTSDWETPATIADQIAQCLWLKMVTLTRSSLDSNKSRQAISREAYLKGRYFLKRRDEDGLRRAATWFRTAILHDASFALAHSGLADSLTLLGFYDMERVLDVMPEAREAALRATELDPDLAEAHASLADIHLHFDRDWEAADRQYRRAIQCNPNYVLGYHWYANLLAAKGQHEAAHIAITHALKMDPASLITQVWAGVTAYLARRYDDAVTHYQSALELDPQFIWTHMYQAQSLVQKKLFAEAQREFDLTLHLSGGSNSVLAMKAHAYAEAGDREAAQAILRGLSKTARKCMPSYEMAAAYTALGDRARALQWLKRACEEHSMKLFMLAQDPCFDSIREHAGFQTIAQSIGLLRYRPAIVTQQDVDACAIPA